MHSQIFVNLPVKDLGKTKAYWSALGFTFNPEFTDDKAAALVLGKDIFAMLLFEKFFAGFIKKGICDTSTSAEAINALSVESREKVDEIARKAVAAGGKIYKEPTEYGWMYGQSIEDLDGHLWEFFFMDASKRPKQ